jgi:glycosyltransferase involved in cell wall biosynthesis
MLSQIQKPDLWIIVDNSSSPEYDWAASKELPWVMYTRVAGEKTIGTLRNDCLGMALAAGAEHIVFWDDDDYYPPTRISSGIKALMNNPEADIAASSRMFLFCTRFQTSRGERNLNLQINGLRIWFRFQQRKPLS